MKKLNFYKLFQKIQLFFKSRLRKKEFVVVAIGDSTIEGIGASKPEKAFAPLVYSSIKQGKKNAVFHNLGKAGAKVQDVIINQLPKAIELKPNLILVSIGANDLMFSKRIFRFGKDFEFLLSTLRQKTQAALFVNNIPDVTIVPIMPKLAFPYYKLMVLNFNYLIKKYTKIFGVYLIDLYKESRLFKEYKELISQDGLHPSDIGYAIWANAFITKIQSVLPFNKASIIS